MQLAVLHINFQIKGKRHVGSSWLQTCTFGLDF